MPSLHEPLTMMQSTDDPEYLAVRERFWRPAPRQCLVCDTELPRSDGWRERVYCSDDCYRRANVIAQRLKRRSAA